MNDFTCILKYTTDKLQQLWFYPMKCFAVFTILQCYVYSAMQQTGVVSASDCIRLIAIGTHPNHEGMKCQFDHPFFAESMTIENYSYIPRWSRIYPKRKYCSIWCMQLICWILPLATQCHTQYHLHPFYFMFKDLVAKQHPTSSNASSQYYVPEFS